MKFTLGFSPCPNDTFIFDALVNKKIDTEGLEFDPILEDVETLNGWAQEGKLDITKLSFPAFFKSQKNYFLLHSGSALGKGVGPLLISNEKEELSVEEINAATVALPGANTTANLLFSYAYPGAKNKRFILFSAIEDSLLKKENDLGVIIHENRFTYHLRGLSKVRDLGEYWEEKMNVPIPLGGIAIHQSVKRPLALKINDLIRKSGEYAFKHYPHIPEYVIKHSQEMSDNVMRQHIDLYVNNYSLELGEDGKSAIKRLHQVYREVNNLKTTTEAVLFL